MPDSLVNVLVKVGKHSNIIFDTRLVKAYRAITANELEIIANTNKSINIVVIENVKSSEYDRVMAFISKFTAMNKDNRVYFNVEDSDEITCGIADELSYDIYMSKDTLYKAINSELGVDISTKLNKKDTSFNDGNIDNTFEDSFETFEEKEEIIEEKEEVVEEKEEIIEEVIEEKEVIIEEKEEIIEEKEEVIEEREEIVEDLYIDNSKEKIKYFEDLVKSIEDERDNYKGILDSLQNNMEVLEEPISLAEYEDLITSLKDIKSRCVELEDVNNNLYTYKSELEAEKAGLEAEKSETSSLYRELKLKVDSGELTNSKDILRLEDEKANLEKEKADLETRLVNLDNEMTKLKISLTENKDRLADEISKSSALSSKIEAMLLSIKEFEKVNSELLNTKLNLETTIANLNVKVIELEAKCLSVDSLIAQSKAEGLSEISNLKVDRLRLESDLEIVKSRLVAKEYQYNTLVQACGMDENGANSMLTNNKTLESVNQTLREQLTSLQSELEKSNVDKMLISQTMQTLADDNKQLKTTLNIVTSGISSGTGVNIPDIKYTGRGMILSVLGSNGVTTTAMSMANQLSQLTSVVYIDFDLISPTADAWFNTPPLVKNLPGIDSTKATGLGILIENKMAFFEKYANQIIMNISKSRKGSLDYISGIYEKADRSKIISADYESFFNYLGSKYSYIVVDFGRLGSSDLSDMLIKQITNISYRNILVSTKDKFDIRNFNTRLFEADINRDRAIWLLNLCENSKIDNSIKNIFNQSLPTIMPINLNLIGHREDFTRGRMTKDVFNVFLQQVIGK